MLTILNSRFRKDIVILFVVSIALAAAGSAALAWVADRYFGKAINGIMGEYGQYDLFFQVRSDTVEESRTEMDRLVGERLPGAEIKEGPALVGKHTFFLALPPELRRREVLEGLDALLSRIPGWAGSTLLAEPRLTISMVHGGAQELLVQTAAAWEEVDYAFVRGGNVEVVLKKPAYQRIVSERLKSTLAHYRLVEMRFPAGYTMEDALAAGAQVAEVLQPKSGRGLVRDVTLAGGGDDFQYLMGTMIEMKRFLGYYAAVVQVDLSGDQMVRRGDHLVLQGGTRPPITGETPDTSDIMIRVESAGSGQAQGIIIKGDSRDVVRPESYVLDSKGRIGRFAGMSQVRSRRDELLHMLDESARLLGEVNELTPEAAGLASGAIEKLLGYSRLLEEVRVARGELEAIREGLDHGNPADGQARLDSALRRLDQASAEIARLGSDLENLRLSVTGLSEVAGRIEGFNNRLSSVSRFLPLGDGVDRLLSTTRTLGMLSEAFAGQQETIDRLTAKLQPALASAEYWREKVLRFQSEDYDYRQLQFPGSEGRRRLEDLLQVTDRTSDALAAVDPTGASGLLQNMVGNPGGEIDLDILSERVGEVRASLPELRDEEIGRSIAVIEQYVGDQAYAGEKAQLLTDLSLSMQAIEKTVHAELGQDVQMVVLPVGSIQPNLRGEVFRVLGEVRTSISALAVLIAGLLTFLLDQALILSVIRRETKRFRPTRGVLNALSKRVWHSPCLYGAIAGALWFPAAFRAAGANLPVVGLWGAGAVGLLIGLFFALTSERFNGVNGDEMMAGEALGLSFDVIMREIVVPAGRPGLMMWLNRHRMQMK